MAKLDNYDKDTFYLAFKDAHPSWSLIGCALTYGIIATFGIVFNSSVIVVTCLTKSFRGSVNYLLALCSLFELVHQIGHFLFVYTAFSGQNFIDYRLAAKILFIPVIGIGGIVPTMFFTGIDRLIATTKIEMDTANENILGQIHNKYNGKCCCNGAKHNASDANEKINGGKSPFSSCHPMGLLQQRDDGGVVACLQLISQASIRIS
ncbi:hypothetical protein niasHT_015160 [Heterodera trifolii]|uniref:7TM GPCR serpentine receptor class x (Srx) domain-containing protein n=1 Tax=Heterodera trifolii TaxID=157864 RepID=A0ABD2L9U8_9BILA